MKRIRILQPKRVWVAAPSPIGYSLFRRFIRHTELLVLDLVRQVPGLFFWALNTLQLARYFFKPLGEDLPSLFSDLLALSTRVAGLFVLAYLATSIRPLPTERLASQTGPVWDPKPAGTKKGAT